MKQSISAEDIIDLYQQLQARGIRIWVDGGWSTDALLGRQLCPHRDFDLAINQKDVPALSQLLEDNGYKEIRRDGEYNSVFGDGQGREVDCHAFITDELERVIGGIEYPTGSLTGTGIINGFEVRCISAEWMIKFLTPFLGRYPEKYGPAISALCEKFDLARPLVSTSLVAGATLKSANDERTPLVPPT